MGKRSNFPRRKRDAYNTPLAAAMPLVPFLGDVRKFAEPCAGDGSLIRHLQANGLVCVYAGDIRTGKDALATKRYGRCDAIITNPPWSRPILHAMIDHFLEIKPAWLLIDADWGHTHQAVPYLKHCSDIVAIGRIKWINGSASVGKDNACWYRFDANYRDETMFHSIRRWTP